MIVDANPIVTACLGRSKSLVQALLAGGADLFMPAPQMRETRLVTTSQAIRRSLDPPSVLAWIQDAIIVVPPQVYGGHEAEARGRLQPGDQKDWPLIALALASGEEVWSNDVDLFGTGITVWNTHNIIRMVRRLSPVDGGTSEE